MSVERLCFKEENLTKREKENEVSDPGGMLNGIWHGRVVM